MRFAEESPITNADTPEARRYNHIHRWLEFSRFRIGLGFPAVLLLSGWTRSSAGLGLWRGIPELQFAVFLYVFILMLGGKLLGLGLDYYGLSLERRFHLSNQKTRSWLWDEVKGFLVGLVVAESWPSCCTSRSGSLPQHWWFIAWAIVHGTVHRDGAGCAR